MPDPAMRHHWLELDRAKLLHNLAGLRAIVGTARIMPVVKANYYGAGAGPLAGALAGQGVDAFAVATVPEAVELREQGIGGLLTVLMYFLAISANSSMVDATGVPGVAIGDTAVLIGRQGNEEIAAAEIAQIVESSYQLLAMIPRAVPRR